MNEFVKFIKFIKERRMNGLSYYSFLYISKIRSVAIIVFAKNYN